MEIYRLKFLNLDGRIKSFETFESEADDAARGRSNRLRTLEKRSYAEPQLLPLRLSLRNQKRF